jgi:hypothetical protein
VKFTPASQMKGAYVGQAESKAKSGINYVTKISTIECGIVLVIKLASRLRLPFLFEDARVAFMKLTGINIQLNSGETIEHNISH